VQLQQLLNKKIPLKATGTTPESYLAGRGMNMLEQKLIPLAKSRADLLDRPL